MWKKIYGYRLLILTITLMISFSFLPTVNSTLQFCMKETIIGTNNISNVVLKNNLNPDPNGELWIPDGYTIPKNRTCMSNDRVHELLHQLKQSQNYDIPSKVDHTYSIHMRPIFNQVGGSCGSASRICYMFAYEINALRGVDGNLIEHRYPSHFTWLLTGQGSSKDQMAIFNGVPNAELYGGDTFSEIYGGEEIYWPSVEEAPDYGWMTGYDQWYNAMINRLEKTEYIKLDTPENLELFKYWMYNHFDDTDFFDGGIAGNGVAMGNGMQTVRIHLTDYECGKKIVLNWGNQINHGASWSGYDDDVGYDFNEDGQITNNIDITDDGKVDMRDWERGALIFLNSWGNIWENQGTVYVPYRLLKIGHGSESYPRPMDAELYHIRKNYAPNKALKIELQYSQRSNLKLSVGISEDITSDVPEKEIDCHHFIWAGNGEVPLLGKWADGKMHSEPMKFMLDLSDLQEDIDTSKMLKYFLRIETREGEGLLERLSLVNYITSNNEEILYPSENIILQSNNIYYFTFIVDSDPQSKIHAEGTLSWEKVITGSTLSGNFSIENIGAPESQLNWEITEYPEWGQWIFTPKNGENLKPEDGIQTVEVEVAVPEAKNTKFSGKIKIINKNNNNDYSTISVSLSTPKNNYVHQNPSLIRFLKNHPILHTIFSQILY